MHIEDAMNRFQVTDYGTDNIYKMFNPDSEQIDTVTNSLLQTLKENEKNNEKTLIVYLFACHGLHMQGSQAATYNEYCPNKQFYKSWPAEKHIRNFAKLFPSSFHLSFFACCREIYDRTKHTGCVSGPELNAIEHFKALDEATK